MTTVAKHVKLSEEKALEIAVRSCSGLTEFATCIEIERAVWGSADVDIVPLPLFVVAAETGGQVLGAFAGDRMVGFTLAIAGVQGRKPFLHSHMTAVLRPFRNQGAGRKLKTFQREEALGRRIDLIEWTFDQIDAPPQRLFALKCLQLTSRALIAEGPQNCRHMRVQKRLTTLHACDGQREANHAIAGERAQHLTAGFRGHNKERQRHDIHIGGAPYGALNLDA